jgi:hypothetical protein
VNWVKLCKPLFTRTADAALSSENLPPMMLNAHLTKCATAADPRRYWAPRGAPGQGLWLSLVADGGRWRQEAVAGKIRVVDNARPLLRASKLQPHRASHANTTRISQLY